MEPADIVRDVSERLDRADMSYMLTGSMAMNYYAEPRMTRDVDFVVELQGTRPGRIEALFTPDYYVSVEAVEEAMTNGTSFNMIHREGLVKVDCFARKPTEHQGVQFGRRRRVEIAGFETWIVSLEDLIVSKLDWARDSHSERQLRDVRNLAAVPFDRQYVSEWVERLGLVGIWDEAQR